MLASGRYFFMNSRNGSSPLSFAQRASVGSLRYAAVIKPVDFSSPAGVSTEPTEIDTLLR